ncbi:MAG: DNA repair protein RadA [bacterium]
MAKKGVTYACTSCGTLSNKWAGQCSDCGEWNTLVEQIAVVDSKTAHRGYAGVAGSAAVTRLSEVKLAEQARCVTGFSELDRVLGGGLVNGSVVLIGGDPGIGKSTLLLQVMAQLAANSPVLYVTGEESLQQIALRADRLELDRKSLACLAETGVERILAHAEQGKPKVLVIDSIQTVYTEQLQSAPGGVAQIRESAAQIVRYAKSTQTTVFLVGHVTKDGALAGPRVLEHMVDTVLYFEGDSGSRYRVIRAIKNRFGAVNELGVFMMADLGLKVVPNPSAIFLSGYQQESPGSAVMVTREGTRPLLVEIQALVDSSSLGNPRRVSVGLEGNRLAMLLAILHRHAGIIVGDQDVFVNVVGGMKISETASDLAVLLAVVSSLRDQCLPSGLIVFGEVGLSGEIRPVYNGVERLKEAEKHGFTTAYVAEGNAPRSGKAGKLQIQSFSRLADLLNAIW